VEASKRFAERHAAPGLRTYYGEPFYDDPYFGYGVAPTYGGSVGIGFPTGHYHRWGHPHY